MSAKANRTVDRVLQVQDVSDGDWFQGEWGSCAVLAVAVGTVPVDYHDNGTATVRLHDPVAGWVGVTVSTTQDPSGAVGIGGIIEWAYGQHLENTGNSLPGMGFSDMADGNSVADVLLLALGEQSTTVYKTQAKQAPMTISQVRQELAEGDVLVAWTQEPNYLVASGHAYRVVGTGKGRIDLLNPWGYDALPGHKETGDRGDGLVSLTWREWRRLPGLNVTYTTDQL